MCWAFATMKERFRFSWSTDTPSRLPVSHGLHLDFPPEALNQCGKMHEHAVHVKCNQETRPRISFSAASFLAFISRTCWFEHGLHFE
jgi:hypothetical protein